MCKYVKEPFAGCYCRQVSSRTIPSITRYCMERFTECPFYPGPAAESAASEAPGDETAR